LRPIHLDPAELIAAIARRAEYAKCEELAIGDLAVHRIVYEDDLLNEEAQHRSLQHCFLYLGVAPTLVATDLVRTTSAPLPNYIANFEEIAIALGMTPYAQMLTDQAYP
jgi:hypothetical protein